MRGWEVVGKTGIALSSLIYRTLTPCLRSPDVIIDLVSLCLPAPFCFSASVETCISSYMWRSTCVCMRNPILFHMSGAIRSRSFVTSTCQAYSDLLLQCKRMMSSPLIALARWYFPIAVSQLHCGSVPSQFSFKATICKDVSKARHRYAIILCSPPRTGHPQAGDGGLCV